jgi:hypothetical protein
MTTVDVNTLREQHSINQKLNAEGKQVNLSFVGVALDSDEKKAKKQKTTADDSAESAKSSKGKLSSVVNDMKFGSIASTQSQNEIEEDSEPKGFGSLLSSFGDHWEPDPLVSFMFDNAPTLMILCQKSLEAMTDAQNTEVNQQLQSSLLSAQDTVKKGQEQASQQELSAAGQFAQAGMGALQTALMASDACLKDNTYSEDLDRHDSVLNNLKSKGEDQVGTSGNAGKSSSGSSLTQDEENFVKNKANEFKANANKKYEQNLAKLEGSLKSRLKQNNAFGLGRSSDAVDAENEVLAKRAASREAFSETFGERDIDKLKGPDSKAVEMRKAFMNELFTKDGASIADMGERMDLIGDWGSKGSSLRKEMLQSYGSTQQGVEMRQSFSQERRMASERANMESQQNQQVAQKRQLVFQTVLGNGASGIFTFLQQSHTIASGNDEAEASLNSAFAQAWSQGQGGLKGQIDQLVQDLTSLLKWFDSAHGSLISAEIQG